MKKILKVILVIVLIPLVLYAGFHVFFYLYFKQFGLIDTELNKQTVAEWKKASQEEKFSACVIMITAVIKHDEIIDPDYKKKISNTKALKAASNECVRDIDFYIEKEKLADSHSVAMTATLIAAYRGYHVNKLPKGLNNPFKDQ